MGAVVVVVVVVMRTIIGVDLVACLFFRWFFFCLFFSSITL